MAEGPADRDRGGSSRWHVWHFSGTRSSGRFSRSLRMQKAQAVNVNLSAFADPNANPALHQMIAQMISDEVAVATNEPDQSAADRTAAAQLSDFDVSVVAGRTDPPKFVVTGRHAFDMTLNLGRLQTVFNQAGHPEISVPPALDDAPLRVEIPRAVETQYGHCPTPASTSQTLANNISGPTPSSTGYSDCLRLREGPNSVVNVPQGVDVEKFAEIGRVAGAKGTLLSMAERRGPSYVLIWAKDGRGYLLTGFGESSHAVELADSVK
jgi:hypothetical protein